MFAQGNELRNFFNPREISPCSCKHINCEAFRWIIMKSYFHLNQHPNTCRSIQPEVSSWNFSFLHKCQSGIDFRWRKSNDPDAYRRSLGFLTNQMPCVGLEVENQFMWKVNVRVSAIVEWERCESTCCLCEAFSGFFWMRGNDLVVHWRTASGLHLLADKAQIRIRSHVVIRLRELMGCFSVFFFL